MMSSAPKYDVIVVGGGPGGSSAARGCAKHGLKVLMLEKRKRPRHKVCAGWLLGSFAQNAVNRNFGPVPQDVLNDPPYLSGFIVHTPGGKRERVEGKIPQAWRKNLDYWMNIRAAEASAEIWDEVRVTSVVEADGRCSVRFSRKGTEQEISAKYVIGCDGCQSVVRKSLYPNLKPTAVQALEHWYSGSLGDLEYNYLHEFMYPVAHYDTRSVLPGSICGVHYKEDFFYIYCTSRIGKWTETMQKARHLLAEFHGFDLNRQPLWVDSLMVPELHVNIIDGSLLPAKGNILLAGDAAGLLDMREGGSIGMAVHSGALAAESVLKAAQEGTPAEGHHLTAMKGMISAVGKMHSFHAEAQQRLQQAADDSLVMQHSVETARKSLA